MKNNIKIPFSYMKNPVHLVAVGFGSGLMPKAPGTFGTLAAIPLYLVISQFDLWLYLALTVIVTVLGVFICDYTSKALGVHDHSGIVIDEIAGYFITMIAVPFDWLWIVVGFVLFRFFDILKPWPISWLDKNLHGGLGIMLDDVLAGFFSLLCLHIIISIS
ncbi:MAG: phosphatidylglycerophosphatase A [endosymbiont of Galathealinum brachiosum]|uniref:Phosphatidylglycerophosphatase A n=1 Tax=endosymbiont of Galathealinum brachiosum TaxID=2200906 RepID=A0A370DFR2_9GAMM|nr:MAG: phosphatidylglycerophosphatase A [endosymbiont of Galathealinum brachiosum]